MMRLIVVASRIRGVYAMGVGVLGCVKTLRHTSVLAYSSAVYHSSFERKDEDNSLEHNRSQAGGYQTQPLGSRGLYPVVRVLC